MNILVTGGAGFIGSAVIRYIIQNTKNCVINVDKLTYAANLESLHQISDSERYFFEKIDICSKDDIFNIFKKYKPQKVIHLAAESHVDNSIASPKEFIDTNIYGTFNLLESSRLFLSNIDDKKKNNFRFLHVSTDEVFGDLDFNDPPFSEHNSYCPSSPYSSSKASSDHLVRAWNRTYGIPTIITNCSNNYGPYQFPEKLIPLTIKNAISNKDLPIYGSGNQIRDWLYVEDHAEALYKVLNDGEINNTYNIGSNNERKNIEVVREICSIIDELKPKSNGSYSDQIVFVKDRPGHDKRYAINSNKIQNKLGWKPRESFDSGLRKTVEWYLAYFNKYA